MNAAAFESWLRSAAPARAALVMGILNITPDSFSDGGRYLSPADAVGHARAMIDQGADILDLGAESTRPGASRVSAGDQMSRLLPVIQAIRGGSDLLLSVDTTDSEVAAAAVAGGAGMINDVSAGRFDLEMLPVAGRLGVPVVLMHMLGEPGTMQQNPVYTDVVREVKDHLAQRKAAALAAGVATHHILVDPGIGFGKTVQHNLAILKSLSALRALDCPILLGTSRKRFIGAVTGVDDPAGRVVGSCATIAWGATNGADVFRVHDVAETVQTIRMIRAIEGNAEC